MDIYIPRALPPDVRRRLSGYRFIRYICRERYM